MSSNHYSIEGYGFYLDDLYSNNYDESGNKIESDFSIRRFILEHEESIRKIGTKFMSSFSDATKNNRELYSRTLRTMDNALCELIDAAKTEKEDEDLIESFDEFNIRGSDYGVFNIIADVIWVESLARGKTIDLSYLNGYNGEYIMFTATYPWLLKEDNNITINDIDNAIKATLGFSVPLDYHTVEYYG